MRTSERPSIDTLISQLCNAGTLRSSGCHGDTFAARNLIFTVLGWQTMLFTPEIGTCPAGELAIADEMDGYHGQGQIILKQDHSACKRSMHQFLMGFGVLLPPPRFRPEGVSHKKSSGEDPRTVQSTSLNASLLKNIGGITIRWIDSLPLHLELDQTSKVLYLFRYPSFCVANTLPRHTTKQVSGVIHAFGAPPSISNLCASTDEISNTLQETILSYRLLFGQSKRARSLFRMMRPFDDIHEQGRDSLLAELCGRKRCNADFCEDRESYNLERHFPIYKSKLIALSHCMSQQRPRTWKELWQDKRDSDQWFTFWAVLVLGGFGLLIGLLQVILQIVQIARQVP